MYKCIRTHAYNTYITYIYIHGVCVCVYCVKLGNIITPCIVDRSKCICLSGPTPTPSAAAARPMEISSSGFAAAAAVHCFIINTQQLITGSDTDTDRRRTRFSFKSDDLLSARLFFPASTFLLYFFFSSFGFHFVKYRMHHAHAMSRYICVCLCLCARVTLSSV